MTGVTAAPRAVMARLPVVARLPAGPGVYRFRDAGGKVLYIGRATHLRQRVGSYWSELRGRRHLARMVPQIERIEAVACDSVHEATWLERNLLERAKPRWNRIRGGLEVPVGILLDHAAGGPRLSVVHLPCIVPAGGAVFGPYLGGTRARLAVSALDRVLPLRYTGDRLDGGEQEMARLRGVSAADRDAFLATVTGVLRHHADAAGRVRELLAVHRDRAAAGLAFEFAARIQEEIEAIDWIVAEQKVTALSALIGPDTPADHDAAGWADGLLVRFKIRRGRLNGWEQRPCGRVAAQPHLDRTPDAWRDFASRGAELGSRLNGM